MNTKKTQIEIYLFVLGMLISIFWTASAYAAMDIDQTLSDEAQQNTIAFDGFAFITGTLEAQSFFPPGKVADYWGFQYLRDNTPDGNGHNTSFLTNCAYNVLYLLNETQFAMLKTLADSQVDQINLYAYQRFPLMKAFRRQLDGDIPHGSSGLNLKSVMSASSDLYKIDGQISFDRAVVYAEIFRTLTTSQIAYLKDMETGGFDSWTVTDEMEAAVKELMKGVSHDVSVALMTYAADLFSWYAGSLEADVYFCPERQGTYFGSFYVKDAPAIGHEGYKIDESLTADAGKYFLDQLATTGLDTLMTDLVDQQRDDLYAGAENIVQVRTDISNLLRSLITDTSPTETFKNQVLSQVLEKSGTYGELDGKIVHAYTMAFSRVFSSMNADQMANLTAMRQTILSGTYDGEPFDFSVCTTFYLYASIIEDESVLTPYISDTDYLFADSGSNPDCMATIDGDFMLHVPDLSYTDPILGAVTYWADFSYVPNALYPESIYFRLVNGGKMTNTDYRCEVSTMTNDFKIHVPDVLLPDGISHVWLDMAYDPALSIDGNTWFLVTGYGPVSNASFSLASDVGVDGGTLPADYTCDGAGYSPAMFWSNAPEGTKEFALIMTTLPGDGTTKWNWVLYGIPKTTTGLSKNSSGVGILGMNSHETMAYDPPCSQGPGAKIYTFTVYALSESPQLTAAAEDVTGDVLTQAISTITLNSTSLNLSYTRPS